MLQCQLLRAGAQVPRRAHASDAGYDLTACGFAHSETQEGFRWVVGPGQRVLVGTGVAVACPENVCFQIWPRSGLAWKEGLGVLAGLVDSGYRGEIKVLLCNHGDRDIVIAPGDRIAQLVPVQLCPGPRPLALACVDRLEPSERADQGFGSTGVAAAPAEKPTV